MCGIVGLVHTGEDLPPEIATLQLEAMRDSLRHRGPDDDGIGLDPQGRIALGHRRLSILDLSPEGHQPMVSQGGRCVLIYNGEVYNYLDLRRELEQFGHTFRGGYEKAAI